MRKITAVQRLGTYCRVSDGGQVDMRKGMLLEDYTGKMTKKPIFFFVRKLREIIVPRDELCRDWYPKYGSHVCGDQYNKMPDMLARFGDRQDTRCEAWRGEKMKMYNCMYCRAHEVKIRIPDGYLQRAEWFEIKSKTHTQHRCPMCCRWTIWIKKQKKITNLSTPER